MAAVDLERSVARSTQYSSATTKSPSASLASVPRENSVGLRVQPTFCPEDVADPFDTVEWELRCAAIKDESGEVLFEQTDCEIPASWSQLATNVVVSKYFYGENGTSERESSVRQLIHRVARTIADWGVEGGYFASVKDGESFYRDLSWLCLHQYGAFNSPVWFNVGLHHQYGVEGDKCNWHWNETSQTVFQPENPYEFPQASACFIQSVDDNMEDIMRLATSEAMLFKFGSGTGSDLSTIRSHREKLSGGGHPSGPLSFMRVYDQIAAVVKSGGKTRRAAKMQSLKVWHPDILEFIECKWKEEQKAHTLIASGKYDANFNGEAYSSILFQNANLSVRVTDDFMQAVEQDAPWFTHWVTQPDKAGPDHQARQLLNRMAECAWHCGDPGVQYDSTINRWNTCPTSGRINASNPCVTGDTLVATADGYRQIIDLVDQPTEIVNGDGQRVFIDGAFKTGHKPVYELKTRSGYRLRLTADHRVMTLRGDVPACELTQDDRVILQQPGFGNDFVPEAFGELLGAALGDGCLTHGRDQDFLFVTLGETEAATAERLRAGIDQCKAWLGEGDLRGQRETNVTTTATGLRVGTSVDAILTKLRHFAVLDQGAENKSFTDEVFDLDRPSQAAILRALFTADGTVANYSEKSQYVSLDSSSLPLLRQVQLLMLGFGMKAKIYENRRALDQTTAMLPDGRGGMKAYPVQQMHSLRISRSSRVVFQEAIGFLPESPKTERLAALNQNVGTYRDRFEDQVDSLTSCGSEDVFDLTEPVSHHFVANGMVVHNCSEYMFLDDTACNLASINLMKFRREDATFDVERFRAACRVFFVAQEILVDHASYPTDRIAKNSHLFRPLGLGYSNLGSLIMTSGAAYDSHEAQGICGALTAILHGEANRTSAELAAAVGPFARYDTNRDPMLNVMQMHRDAVEQIDDACPDYLKTAARRSWDEVLHQGRKYGFRNAQATVLAPTGTISFMMDCDTTGIEPDIALVKFKQLAGGGMLKIVNQTVPLALKTIGYDQPQIEAITAYIDEKNTIEGAPGLLDEHLSVFDCAFKPAGGQRSIDWRAHVKMMAAAQPFLSGAISKTVNMPAESTPVDIAEAYRWGWKLGLKALAIYRDGSKQSQPLSTTTEGDRQSGQADAKTARPRRERLEDTRQSSTHKFNVAGHEGYITVGLYPDGRPGELFITMAKEGSTVGGLMDCFGTAISMSLQYGVPLEVLVNKFSYTRFEPMGHTTNSDIRIAKSVVDYIFRWLGNTYIPGFREAQHGSLPAENGLDSTPDQNVSRQTNSQYSKNVASPQASSHGHGANGSTAKSPETSAVVDVPTVDADQLERAGAAMSTEKSDAASRGDQFARFQSDAPSCDNCGAITVRNGNCYLCHNCGNSMGCS